MEAFLHSVAQQILAEHPDDCDKVMVVFNNHRSGLFLRKHFARLDKQSFFMPQITVIDELVARLGGLQIVQPEFLLFELYDIHCQIGGEDRKYATFEDFISFGDLMLSDFSELDLYMADARQLFINLHGIKAIGEWSIDGSDLSPFQKQYLEFYRSLYQYYTLLRERLQSQGKAYSGMAYRCVAEHIDSMIDMADLGYVYFVGFNVLSECERRIVKAFCKAGRGQLITDGDPYYYADEAQEAGTFLRRYSSEFPTIGNYEPHFGTEHKEITVVKCPENVLQCKFAGQLLAQHPEWAEDSTQTAVVLADEKLLMPMLNSLPEQVTAANITMGYPYTDSSIHETVLKLFALYQHARNGSFHHTDVVEVLCDYHVSKLHRTSNLRSGLMSLLAAGNMVYIAPRSLLELLAGLGVDVSLVSFLLAADNKTVVEDFWDICRTLATKLTESGAIESNRKEREAMVAMVDMANYLSELQASNHFIENLDTLQKIYTRLSRRHSVSFFGQPLSGLQILGMLETRNLDFKRVILLSANEGVLPSGRGDNTLIPYDLKSVFGLPTYQQKDAVFAYHFYRLLQRAEQVWLVCSTETNASGKGEPSRFVIQVAKELAPRFADTIEFAEQVVEVESLDLPLTSQTVAPKSPFVMKRLAEINGRGFSPSALNNYRACPLKFYYENILKIKEKKDVVEDLDQSDLGTLIHETLQQIFSKDSGLLQAATLRSELENIDATLQLKFEHLFSSGQALEGRNSLLYSIAKSQICNMLKLEIAELEKGRRIEVIGLEENLEYELDIDGNILKLSGVADRIDRRGGVVCIADYKTGKFDPNDLTMDSGKLQQGKVPDKWFQVMFYALLYNRSRHCVDPMLSGIYPLRNIGSYLVPATFDGEAVIEPEVLDHFEALVASIMAEIFDTATPFAAADDSAVCAFCPAKNTCPKFK